MTAAIHIDDRQLRDLKKTLEVIGNESLRKRALKRSASDAVKSTKTDGINQTSRALATRTKKAIRQSFRSRIATTGGTVIVQALPIPAHRFENKLVGPRPPRGSRPVGTSWYRDSAMNERVGAFRLWTKQYANSPIVERRGKARLPVSALYGPTAFDALNAGGKGQRRIDNVIEFGAEVYASELDRQIDLIFRGL